MTANKHLVGTLMTIGDVTVSIAIVAVVVCLSSLISSPFILLIFGFYCVLFFLTQYCD